MAFLPFREETFIRRVVIGLFVFGLRKSKQPSANGARRSALYACLCLGLHMFDFCLQRQTSINSRMSPIGSVLSDGIAVIPERGRKKLVVSSALTSGIRSPRSDTTLPHPSTPNEPAPPSALSFSPWLRQWC